MAVCWCKDESNTSKLPTNFFFCTQIQWWVRQRSCNHTTKCLRLNLEGLSLSGLSCDFPQEYSWKNWEPWECHNWYNRKTGVAPWNNFQDTLLTILMIQWWVNACISRNIRVQGCCRASCFFREASHTHRALAPWPRSQLHTSRLCLWLNFWE